jgi:DNA-binding transcriptional LysR family regulator
VILVGCRQAGFAPRFAHTPSLIGTVLTYVEAGAGIGIATDSVLPPSASLRFIPLRPRQTVPLVLVWHEDDDPPPARRFRELLLEWKAAGRLWPRLKE